MSAQEQMRAYIRRCPYLSEHRDRVVNDLLGLSASYRWEPKLLDIAEGSRAIQICGLEGNLPVTIASQGYSIPMLVVFPERYPMTAPQLYVRPTPNMNIKASAYVNQQGSITHQGLTNWTHKSSLRQILQELQGVFAQQCPVYINAHYQIHAQAVETTNARILDLADRMRTATLEECKGWEATKQRLEEHTYQLQQYLQHAGSTHQLARDKLARLTASSKELEQKLIQAAYSPSTAASLQDLRPEDPTQQSLLSLVAAEQGVTDGISLLERLLDKRQVTAESALRELKSLYVQLFMLQRKQEKAAQTILLRR